MNSAEYVNNLIKDQKAQGLDDQQIAWNAALACVGWPYVFGAVGEECKPAKRSQYGTKFYLKGHETIVTRCKAISWDTESKTCKVTGNCSGCKWNLPVRMFDCRGFTRKILQMVYGWTLMGSGCTAQWNDESNWKVKGKVSDGVPQNTIVCLFYSKDNKEKTWEHTGFGYNGETVECSNGVQHSTTLNKKWTHWGVPACVKGDIPVPTPTPTPTTKPTLRKGSSGPCVVECQTDLITLGYSCGPKGADGKYGDNTIAAVKAFQKDHGLTADGVCGKNTWAALDKAMADRDQPQPVVSSYTVKITGLDLTQAQAIAANYPGNSQIIEEE